MEIRVNMLIKNGNTIEFRKDNKHRIQGILCLCFVMLFCLMLSGCSKEDYLNEAATLYKAGEYVKAESCFLKALQENKVNAPAWTGYGFSMLKRGDTEGAKAAFLKMLELEKSNPSFYGAEKDTAVAVRKGLFDIYMAQKDYKSAVDMLRNLGDISEDATSRAEYKAEAAALAWKYFDAENDSSQSVEMFNPDELIPVISDSIAAGNDSIKSYRMRANLYYLKQDWAKWEADERMVISLKDYAFDEYCAIYEVCLKYRDAISALAAIDEILTYMKGHSSYIDSYDSLIALALKGAELAEYNDYTNSPEYYFEKAEQYIAAAEEKNMSNSQVLKYSVIIAEKRGKLELAYKLLGVYLEHCPEDRMAIKERSYLKNRAGVTEE